MTTRRDFLRNVLGGVAAGAAAVRNHMGAAGRLAWPGPIGLELYTVRDLMARDPAQTLKAVAAVGYKEVEIGPGSSDARAFKQGLRDTGLTAPSGYFDAPKGLDDIKKSVAVAHDVFGLRYLVVGDNP